jgi:hypothetical protein
LKNDTTGQLPAIRTPGKAGRVDRKMADRKMLELKFRGQDMIFLSLIFLSASCDRKMVEL